MRAHKQKSAWQYCQVSRKQQQEAHVKGEGGLAVLLHTGRCTHEENRILSQEEWKGSRGLKTRTWQERAGILQPGDERPAGSQRRLLPGARSPGNPLF